MAMDTIDFQTSHWLSSVSGVFVYSSFFIELLNSARAGPIAWEEIAALNIITSEELESIKNLDNELRTSNRRSPVSINTAIGIIGILTKSENEQHIASILALADFALEVKACNLDVRLLELREQNPDYPIFPLVKLLDRQKTFIQLSASKIITHLIIASKQPIPIAGFDVYLTFIRVGISSTAPKISELVTQYVMSLLSVFWIRKDVYAFQNCAITNQFLKMLKPEASSQLQYQIICCLLEFSLDSDIAKDMIKRPEFITTVVEVLKMNEKQKIFRVSLSFFVAYSLANEHEGNSLLLACKLPVVLKSIVDKRLIDEEMKSDHSYLSQVMKETESLLSTFEEYLNEVITGVIDWTPAHLSEHFWIDNAQKLVSHSDGIVLRKLTDILIFSTNPVAAAVACHDIGQISKFYPESRRLLVEYGAKEQLMNKMTDANSDVRYQALLALQKFMTMSWKI